MKQVTLAAVIAASLCIAPAANAGGSCSSSASKASTYKQASNSPDIVDVAVEAGTFQTLAAALTAADLVEVLKGDGPFTVFAPTDDAFAALPQGTVESLLKPENKHKLISILTYHVVSGEVSAVEAVSARRAKTVEGQRVKFSIDDGQLMVNNANIVATDIAAENGVIHVIDRVLLP